MNLPSYNNQTNNIVEEDTPLLQENQTASYGLETSNTTEANQQLNSISDDNLFDESVAPLPLDGEDSYSELLFIDSAIPDSQTLIDNISGAADVVVLDKAEDEIAQITEHLEHYQQLDAVHIVSLGESGQLTFANTALNQNTLTQYDNLLNSWSNSLAEDADILLYGCDVSMGTKGYSFIRQLSQITNADIKASVDKTGASGNWILETPVGKIETDSIFNPTIATEYQYTLDESIFSFTPDPGFDFSTNNGDTGFDFGNVNEAEFVILDEVDIDGDGEDFEFSSIESGDIAEIDYTSVPADTLEILTTEQGLSFSEFKAEDFAELDINNVPAENIQIMQNAGLDLTSYSTDTVADVKLGVVETFGYIDEASYGNTFRLTENMTFGELSEIVVANDNLYSYKSGSVNLDDGFSISEAQQFDFNDYKALDFAFDGDFIFDSSYYLEQNPDVAGEGVNPFTQYFTSGAYAPEFRDPTPYFDSSFYLENNPDVAEAGVNPLLQYFNTGAGEGRFATAPHDSELQQLRR